MPAFSKSSKDRLATCHEDLQVLFNEVIKHFDCKVIWGHRDKFAQDEAYASRHSTKRWPNSKHNQMPSIAVDVAPYPIDWDDRDQFHLFAGYVLGTAEQLYQIGMISHRIRFGGDWDRDMMTKDNKFDDLAHFELMMKRT